MEKNTVLAVVLSTVVLITFFIIQNSMSSPVQQEQQEQSSAINVTPDDNVRSDVTQSGLIQEFDALEDIQDSQFSQIEEFDALQEEFITINTNTLTVVLTNTGGDMVSWKLKDHLDHNENVDMIFRNADAPAASRAFSIAFGGMEASAVSNLFHINRVSEHIVEFYRDFSISNTGDLFRLTKRYEFKPNDYMFELTITLDSEQNTANYNFSGNAYTLTFGPQIGPKFEKLDARYDYRQYFAYNGKRRKAKVNDIVDVRPAWTAIAGKYFTFIAIPHVVSQISYVFSETTEPGIPSASRFSFIRPAADMRTVKDTYRFYLGPKSENELKVYHTGLNDFGLKETSLTEMASSRGILSPLETLLKWMLLLCYKIVPNYGVAIILLTLIIKILFFPLTKKSSEATSRMQELSPKIKELQEKYKSNPQKLNAEMAAFYQKEGYNPLSGCLPMLLQIPIFIAMYQLFNNHFDLRGASFIPGWIPDLSMPEAIFNFPDGFSLPILGWTALRALPFIYVGSQLMYGKFTQTPGQQSPGQMKMMLYIMPIAFFFILYNVPSGLLLYWIFSNIFTLVQQIIINKYKKAKAPPPDTTPQYVIAPKKKKKR